jgi:transcriptional regulator with XRE-family HTH domain
VTICLQGFGVSRVTDEGRHVAAVLRAIRAERGLTQAQVAKQWGMTVDGYRPYEAGRRQLRTGALPGLAAALGITASDLSSRLGLHDVTLREIRVAECADIMSQLADEPPEVSETILRWLRESVNIAKMRRLEKN